MSQTIDTKVVEMRFDNSNFEKNVAVSLNSLKNLNKSVDQAGKNRGSLDELARASEQVGASFENVSSKSSIMSTALNALSGIGVRAFNNISTAVAGFATNMMNSLSVMQAMRDGFAEYELKMGSIQTILAGAKIIDPSTGRELTDEAKRLEIVNQKLDELNAYSDKTIYSFKDMTSNIGKFTNAGVNLDDSVAAIQGVANVAAISGANAQQASAAMYNFSQALSQGSVKLIDWKSISNANMGTMAFKQNLLDTALALKTVRQEGDHYISTTTDMNGKVSDAITSTKGFEESLSHQWLTTEVLTQTLKNYSTDVRDMTDDELDKYKESLLEIGYTSEQVAGIIETSKKAFDAATEVKTFTQMIDTLKESLGSGWAETWQIVFGDFLEAKKLWTGLNNTIDGMLKPISKARNAILQMWKDNGGREALIKSFKNLYQAVKNLFAPLKELWKALTPNTEHTGKALATISKWIEKLTALVAKGASVVGKVLATILKPVIYVAGVIGNALMKLFSVIKSVFGKISDFFKPVTKAVREFSSSILRAFDNKVVAGIKSFGSALAKALDTIKTKVSGSSAVQKLVASFVELKRIMKDLILDGLIHLGAFASRAASYFSTLWNSIKPFVSSALTSALSAIADFALPKIQKALTAITKAIKSFGDFLGHIDLKNSGLFQGLKSFGSDAITYLVDKFHALRSVIGSLTMPKSFAGLLDTIINFTNKVFDKGAIDKKIKDTGDAIEKVAKVTSDKKFTGFQKFLDSLTKAFEWVSNAANIAYEAIKGFVDFIITNTPKAIKSLHDFVAGDDGVITVDDIVNTITMVMDSLSLLFNSIALKNLSDVGNSVDDALAGIANAFTNFTKRVNARIQMAAMKDLAIAVGILAASMYVLAQIPTGKLIGVAVVIGILAKAIVSFYNTIASSNMNLMGVVGNFSIAALLVSIGLAMIGVAASIGILVAALAVFPKVIEQYNKLGDNFRAGMERVKEVLAEIFSYLDSLATTKFGLRGALALLGLVKSLDMIRKTIIKYANKKTGKAMADGLARIKEVMNMLGDFLSSASFGGINIGINFNTVGMAAMIWAIGDMLTKIAAPIKQFAALNPEEYNQGFDAVKKILRAFEVFLITAAGMSALTGTGLKQWLGIALNIAVVASAIGTVVESLDKITTLINKNPHETDVALQALMVIFGMLDLTLAIIGNMNPQAAVPSLVGMGLAIGILTACVVALVPIAASKPGALIGSVFAVGTLMVAFGVALRLAGSAANETDAKDLIKVVAMAGVMLVIVNAMRRLAKAGDPTSIVAAAAAIAIAAVSFAGAIGIISAVSIHPLAIVAMALLAAAIWGVVFAIHELKGASGEMKDGAENIGKSAKEVGETAKTSLLDVFKDFDWSSIFGDIDLGKIFEGIDFGAALRHALDAITLSAGTWAQDMFNIGMNVVDGLSEALSNPANAERLKQSMVTLGKAIVEGFCNFLGIASPSTVMMEKGRNVIDGLVQGLMEFPGKIAQWLAAIGPAIIDGIGNVVTSAIEKGREFIQGLGDGIQNGKEFVATKASELGEAVVSKVDKVKEIGGKALSAVRTFASNIAGGASPSGSAASRVASNVHSSISVIKSQMSSVASKAASQFAAKIRAGAATAKSAATAIVTSAKSAFHGIGSSFSSFGVSAAQGFKNGILSMVSSIAAAAARMVTAAKNAAKRAQRSNSPSKDFMEFGGWAAEGYAMGLASRANTRLIETNAEKMINAAKNVVSSKSFGLGSLSMNSDSATKALTTAMSQISDALNEDIDTNPKIRPVIDMTNVNRSASSISSIFNDKKVTAGLEAAMSIKENFEAGRNDNQMDKAIRALTKQLGAVTETMNSRALNNYITIDGAGDPNAFADDLIRSFRLNARTV